MMRGVGSSAQKRSWFVCFRGTQPWELVVGKPEMREHDIPSHTSDMCTTSRLGTRRSSIYCLDKIPGVLTRVLEI